MQHYNEFMKDMNKKVEQIRSLIASDDIIA